MAHALFYKTSRNTNKILLKPYTIDALFIIDILYGIYPIEHAPLHSVRAKFNF